MKNLTLKNTFACGFVFFLMSCEKENITITETQNETPVEQNQRTEDEVLFLLNGETLIGMNDIEWTDQTHFLYDYEGANLAFDSDANFIAWANEDDNRAEFIVKLEETYTQQAWAESNGYLNEAAATDRYAQGLIDAAGGDRSSWGILFDNQNYSGSPMVSFGGLPSLVWFNNRAESLFIPLTVGALCDRTWFRGAKFWYWAIPAGGIWTFNGFNNRAESNI